MLNALSIQPQDMLFIHPPKKDKNRTPLEDFIDKGIFELELLLYFDCSETYEKKTLMIITPGFRTPANFKRNKFQGLWTYASVKNISFHKF